MIVLYSGSELTGKITMDLAINGFLFRLAMSGNDCRSIDEEIAGGSIVNL